MLHAYVRRFDMTGTVGSFFGTKRHFILGSFPVGHHTHYYILFKYKATQKCYFTLA